ncbi:secondary thiamine-phosphate synthase enzyme YjbQ [Lacticaseibacillus nasuensis]|uniref:secondary thiamine-phosphate synthase enzyme YjbQ n=1 Tax=Lacticaseibacillus nasuensis TaxID=944671 RepID=UPI002245F221|nr:secondary thiamine-phosphate synthase enzyme YjbQ [Lacticaseibacillus nasuensis]MCX2456019.1 secondary thiamine-phosphate synthase enzyme YjbQ [Lacticaseibacillus nasuensis]
MLKKHQIKTTFNQLVPIHEVIKQDVKNSGVEEGLCVVYCPHTTAGLTITSRMDPRGLDDIQDEYTKLIPTRIDFKHQVDTPQDAAGHIKATLSGDSLSLIVTGGKLLLGGSQGIYFMEFDGPRSRNYFVKVIGD